MKPRPLFFILLSLLVGTTLLPSCGDIIEPSIKKSNVQLEAPSDQYQSTSYTINFWWDEVGDALSYHLQVVTPTFASPGSLVLDTIVKKNKFSFNLNPGNYQWRVMAQNGSSQTVYTSPRSFTVTASSIKQQSVQLTAPANNFITNQGSIIFQWGSLYGATKYHFQIDTNNFVNESSIISDQVIPGQQINFAFPKDQVYQWRIRAENDTAQSKWSSVNLVTYDHIPPAKISLIAPTKGQTIASPVILKWNASASAIKYKVYAYKSDSTTLYNQSFPVTVNTTNYNFTPGNPGDKIYWRVSGLDAAGNEGETSILSNFILQ